jgi:hypothetical protein
VFHETKLYTGAAALLRAWQSSDYPLAAFAVVH